MMHCTHLISGRHGHRNVPHWLMSDFTNWATSTTGPLQQLGRFTNWAASTTGPLQQLGRFNNWAASTTGPLQQLGRFNNWAALHMQTGYANQHLADRSLDEKTSLSQRCADCSPLSWILSRLAVSTALWTVQVDVTQLMTCTYFIRGLVPIDHSTQRGASFWHWSPLASDPLL